MGFRMDVEKLLLETYRKWNDENLVRMKATLSKPGSMASAPFLQVLRERGLHEDEHSPVLTNTALR